MEYDNIKDLKIKPTVTVIIRTINAMYNQAMYDLDASWLITFAWCILIGIPNAFLFYQFNKKFHEKHISKYISVLTKNMDFKTRERNLAAMFIGNFDTETRKNCRNINEDE